MCAHFSGRGMEGGRGSTWANFEESAQKSGVYLMFVLCLLWCICSTIPLFCMYMYLGVMTLFSKLCPSPKYFLVS